MDNTLRAVLYKIPLPIFQSFQPCVIQVLLFHTDGVNESCIVTVLRALIISSESAH